MTPAQWKATVPQLVAVTVEGREHLVPLNLVRTYEPGARQALTPGGWAGVGGLRRWDSAD
ncbi:hypothetical protein [Kitasatospora sp. CMC57]|uniref:hypothetical protein n=1 Tax=Kitasatospora sp. CMC57 TaxID=3231513 RepID=UPI0038B54F95